MNLIEKIIGFFFFNRIATIVAILKSNRLGVHLPEGYLALDVGPSTPQWGVRGAGGFAWSRTVWQTVDSVEGRAACSLLKYLPKGLGRAVFFVRFGVLPALKRVGYTVEKRPTHPAGLNAIPPDFEAQKAWTIAREEEARWG